MSSWHLKLSDIVYIKILCSWYVIIALHDAYSHDTYHKCQGLVWHWNFCLAVIVNPAFGEQTSIWSLCRHKACPITFPFLVMKFSVSEALDNVKLVKWKNFLKTVPTRFRIMSSLMIHDISFLCHDTYSFKRLRANFCLLCVLYHYFLFDSRKECCNNDSRWWTKSWWRMSYAILVTLWSFWGFLIFPQLLYSSPLYVVLSWTNWLELA